MTDPAYRPMTTHPKPCVSPQKTKSGKILPKKQNTGPADDQVISIYSADTPGRESRKFIFRSPAMHAIYTLATQVAGSDAAVLIYGESGTGKELFARLLHTLSDRNARPFVPVNCGELQGELFADKFFGHEAGAYTGASRLRKGAFEMAGNGTLFLDEVGDIAPGSQVEFLRVLEERSFRRMGGERDIPFQARIVAATNRPLMRMVQEGRFRMDLFYRLNVVPVELPPLRERREDIPLIAEHCLNVFRHRYHRHELSLDPLVLKRFSVYGWPGNVRELRNLMERLVLLAKEPVIEARHLPVELQPSADRTASILRPDNISNTISPDPDTSENPDLDLDLDLNLNRAVRQAEKRAILRALAHTGGHKGKAAQVLGISQRSLRYKITEYGLKGV
ncbi:sigma-54 dependent transcriptional regulator [Desulfosarcina sp. OttesenSCG-928-G17]|nr:sigma-54 dependent transcriptional regulator [Desulfosarcina sp. OttesenSCG-928-G17]